MNTPKQKKGEDIYKYIHRLSNSVETLLSYCIFIVRQMCLNNLRGNFLDFVYNLWYQRCISCYVFLCSLPRFRRTLVTRVEDYVEEMINSPFTENDYRGVYVKPRCVHSPFLVFYYSPKYIDNYVFKYYS